MVHCQQFKDCWQWIEMIINEESQIWIKRIAQKQQEMSDELASYQKETYLVKYMWEKFEKDRYLSEN